MFVVESMPRRLCMEMDFPDRIAWIFDGGNLGGRFEESGNARTLLNFLIDRIYTVQHLSVDLNLTNQGLI